VFDVIYDIDADASFLTCSDDGLARRTSSSVYSPNKLIQDLVALTPHERLDLPSACNDLLLSVHERVRGDTEGS